MIETYTERQVLDMMYEYYWSMKRLQDMRSNLENIFAKVAAGGVESTMPKGQGGTSDPIYNEVLRRERATKALEPLRRKVLFIQRFTASPAYDQMDWKNKIILELTLEGLSQRQIADELRMHHNTVNNRQRQIAKKITAGQNGQDGQTVTSF